MASKYVDIHPPDVSDIVRKTKNTYNKQEVLAMEVDILNTISF